MIRTSVTLALWVALAGVGQSREHPERRPGGNLLNIHVVNGELRAGKHTGTHWLVRQTPRGTLVCLDRGERAGAYGGWYLNFDHRGKDTQVGLVPQPGPGCYWSWQEGSWHKTRDFGRTFSITVRPTRGPLAGWSLSLVKKKLMLTRDRTAEIKFQGEVDDLDDGK
jgi:hypothetical protein